ncbi:MAG TPA: DUF4178 domain-containing protein, partial [Blastocatellia bacterium]|nr:DUF4178 domain-containing protein [Blastocatellia bacterium]
QGISFELTGRAQIAHQAGGLWDEWYAAFADGRWGWLAEAQGRFYMTFQQTLPEQALIPPMQYLELGQPVAALRSSIPFVVSEKGEARMMGAKGEIPYLLVPGETYQYADLSGPRGEFATIDYSEERPLLFVGREVSLAELGFAGLAAPEREARRVEAVQLSCPRCGGPLALRAPDQTERVTCPNCGSLLDVNQGRLQFLKALQPGRVRPIIPLGTTGEIGGGRFTVIGFLQRGVMFDQVKYYWEEYLLYDPKIGFRWLVRSDDNWNFVEPVPPGSVTGSGRTVMFNGKRFKLYQDAVVWVEYVTGEFYWKVNVNEQVRAADYIHPPYMLSKEVSLYTPAEQAETGGSKKGRRKQKKSAETGEINWSLGTYMPRKQVEKIFGVQGLPSTSKIAPNQPFLHKKVYKYWGLLMLAGLLLGFLVMVSGSRRNLFQQTYALEPVKSAQETQVRFSEPFDLEARKNIKVTIDAPVDNSWLYVEGDLVDEATGLVQGFSLPVEYYHGVEGGESWSEGSRSSEVHLSALPAGKYTLRLEAQWERWQQPISMTVKVEQGVPRILHIVLTLVLLSIIPIIVLFYHYSFEKRRWEDSDYSPYESS